MKEKDPPQEDVAISKRNFLRRSDPGSPWKNMKNNQSLVASSSEETGGKQEQGLEQGPKKKLVRAVSDVAQYGKENMKNGEDEKKGRNSNDT